MYSILPEDVTPLPTALRAEDCCKRENIFHGCSTPCGVESTRGRYCAMQSLKERRGIS